MVSVAIRPLASLKWPPALKFPDQIPANFEALITVYHRLATFFRSDSIISFILYSVGTFLAITMPAYMLLYSYRKKKIDKSFIPAAEVNEGSPAAGLTFGPMDGDAFSQGNTNDFVTAAADAIYAEEIQFHEALMVSIITSETANSPSSSLQEPISNKQLPNSHNKSANSPQTFCGICLEHKDSWQMFGNDTCPHSFCCECTSSHIIAKINDRWKKIPCPAINCKAVLNSDACRLMIPQNTLIQWDESLCMSLIPESQKLYCPFRDCSSLLVNDSEEVVEKIKCPLCNRSFCAECRVPWHSDFTCKEFRKVCTNKDKMVKILARKKNWQKCPKCKMYVEKTEGCVHIVCRCRYEFCYGCGSKWTDSHGNCRPK